MRRLLPLLVLLGASSAASLPCQVPWTLMAALAEARTHSPAAVIAAARIESAQAMVDQANAPTLPQVTLAGGYTQTNNPMMAFGAILNQGAFSPTIDFNHPGQTDNVNLTGVVGYALYNGGRTSAGLAAARSGATATTHDRDATFARLDAAVVRAYFGIRQSREALDALDAAVASFEESLRVARLRFDAGQLLRSELLNLEVQLAQSREQQLAARHQTELAARQFLFLLGRPAAAEVALAHDDPGIAALTAPTSADLDQRPERRAAEARLAAANDQIAVARSGTRPALNAFASYQLDHGWRHDGSGDSWMAGVQAEWRVFDGKANTGRVREARARRDEIAAGLTQVELALQFELDRARLAHELAAAQLAVTATLVEQADEAARISRARFEAGGLLSTELIGAETRLTAARVRRAVAVAAERIAAAEFRRAAGLPILETPTTP